MSLKLSSFFILFFPPSLIFPSLIVYNVIQYDERRLDFEAEKTEVISLRRISAAVKMFSEKIYSDHITLYAAQSSFSR